MDFLGRGRSSQEPNHLHGVMSSFPPPSSTFVCFPILVFGLLFVSFHVRLYLIMVLLFLCQQFILLPCHLIMCCVNRVLLCCRSLRIYLGYWLVSMCVRSLGLLPRYIHFIGDFGDCSLLALHQQTFLFFCLCPTGLASLSANLVLFHSLFIFHSYTK